MGRLIIAFNLMLLSCGLPCFADLNQAIEQQLSASEQTESRLRSVVNAVQNKAAEQQNVKQVAELIQSTAFLNRVNHYQQSAKAVLLPEQQASQSTELDLSNLGDRVLLFVSSSMPVDTLRQYAKDLNQVGGIMVFSGFIGGAKRIMPTQQFLQKIIIDDPNCQLTKCSSINLNVSFDPKRFLVYGIEKVPALIYEKNVNMAANCQPDRLTKPKHIIYGDAALKGMLAELYRVTADSNIKTVIEQL